MDNISSAVEAAGKKLTSIECRLDEPMKYHTSFGIGGPLRAMFFPQNKEDLASLCELLHMYEITPLIIGNGTNILADDSGSLEMVAVKTAGIDSVEQTGDTEITAGAGISLSSLAVFARECGLTGFEYAHGIPGSLGGAVSMNAGAYGREMKDVVKSTDAFSNEAGIYTVKGAEHGFSYRRSIFTDISDIIISSVICLQKCSKKSIAAKMEELCAKRCESQPLELPNAGSTFKRPENGYAATLIEQAGLKGFTIGGAQVSSKHAGFVVNSGGATFKDIMAVIEHVRAAVFEKFGISLEPEIKIIKAGH